MEEARGGLTKRVLIAFLNTPQSRFWCDCFALNTKRPRVSNFKIQVLKTSVVFLGSRLFVA